MSPFPNNVKESVVVEDELAHMAEFGGVEGRKRLERNL